MKQQTFTTVEAAAETLGRLYQAHLVQLDSGPVQIDVRGAAWGRCAITQVETTRRLVSTGVRRHDLVTITPITQENAQGRYRGLELKPGTLLVLDPGGESVQQVPAGQRQMAISIPLELLQRVAEVDCGGMQARFLRWQALQPAPRVFSQLIRAARQPLHGPRTPAAAFSEPADEWLVSALLESLSGTRANVESATAQRRRWIARQAEELMRADLHHVPSVLKLCEAIGTSRRMLFYAFQELYGVSPGAYSKTLRLHAARQAIRANDDRVSVQQIAWDFGFKHPGQFAIDYARAFGESPSQTRR